MIDKAIDPCLGLHTWNGKTLFISEMNFLARAVFSTWKGTTPTERLVMTVPAPRYAQKFTLRKANCCFSAK